MVTSRLYVRLSTYKNFSTSVPIGKEFDLICNRIPHSTYLDRCFTKIKRYLNKSIFLNIFAGIMVIIGVRADVWCVGILWHLSFSTIQYNCRNRENKTTTRFHCKVCTNRLSNVHWLCFCMLLVNLEQVPFIHTFHDALHF